MKTARENISIDAEGKPCYQLHDYRGNVAVVVAASGKVLAHNRYYPYGEAITRFTGSHAAAAQSNATATAARYRFGAKEHETMHGLNAYDFGPRLLSASLPVWDCPDRQQERYHPLSPYTYCAANPIRYADPSGEDVCVLLIKGGTHLAMLIQNEDKKWGYYSMNGDGIFKATDGKLGGCNVDNTGERTFSSPQEFLDSDYNQKGTKEDVESEKTCGYTYKEGYIIKATPEQDKKAAESFKDTAKSSYNLFTNNCSQAVATSLHDAGILREPSKGVDVKINIESHKTVSKILSKGISNLINHSIDKALPEIGHLRNNMATKTFAPFAEYLYIQICVPGTVKKLNK